MTEESRGDYIVELYKDGQLYDTRYLSCAPETFQHALVAWASMGFTAKILHQPTIK